MGDLERLLVRLAELCEARAPSDAGAAEAETVMVALLGEAPRDVRARFAVRVAGADWPSARLIETLAGDDIEVAGPVIAESPRLGDEALIDLASEGSAAHRLAIARRPRLSAPVVAALATAGADPSTAPGASEVKLVGKLAAAGALEPGWLVRALKERRLGQFEAGLARLGDFSIEEVRRAVNDAGRPELLALALAGVGLDRSAFPAVLGMVRGLNGGRPGGGEAGARRGVEAFGLFGRQSAARAFRFTAAEA